MSPTPCTSARRFLQHAESSKDSLGRRGHKDDLLYKIRGLLRRGREHLSEKAVAKLNACLIAGDPGWEVTLAWHAYQQLRSMYQQDSAAGRAVAEKVLDSFHQCPIPEVARLGRTLRMWREHVMVRFETHRISNGGTEAVNLTSRRRVAWLMASERSSTTACGSCSRREEPAPTDPSRATGVRRSAPRAAPSSLGTTGLPKLEVEDGQKSARFVLLSTDPLVVQTAFDWAGHTRDRDKRWSE